MHWKMTVTAAAFGLIAVPALAGSPMFDQDFGMPVHPTLAGHIEFGAGPEHYSESYGFGDTSSSRVRMDGAARVNMPLGGLWNLEAEGTVHDAWSSGSSSPSAGAYAHLWAMFPSAAVGVFAGGSTGSVGTPLFLKLATLTGDTFVAGLEGEAYLNRVTLGGQFSVSTTDFGGPASDYHGWLARAYAAFYLDPETKIVGDVRYSDFASSLYSLDGQNRWQFIASAEHRFAGTPWSIWASGSYSTVQDTDYTDSTSNQWNFLVGFRLFMDDPSTTLYRHDREVPFRYDNQMRLAIGGVT